jgi:hypothetical protein
MKDGKVEQRYRITHKDGKPIHPARRLFVLSPDTDPYAAEALRAYAELCKEKYPQLAESIIKDYDLDKGSV